MYFKAISRLNRQLYQTLLLHLGAAVTTLFLRGKAVHKALEGACESWKQPEVTQNNRCNQNLSTSRKHGKSFLLTSLSGVSVACEHLILLPALLSVLILQ